MDNNGNATDKQIGGNSESERFLRGLQATISSGRINEFLPPEYRETLSVHEQPPATNLHPFTEYAQTFYARYNAI